MVYGFARVVMTSEYDCGYEYDASCEAGRKRAQTSGRIGAGFMIAGAGLWLGSSIYDVVLAKRAADSWNARHSVMLTPGLVETAGKKTPGVFVSARFPKSRSAAADGG